MPMTMWKAAAMIAEKICGSADLVLVSYLLSDRQLAIISRNASSLLCSEFSLNHEGKRKGRKSYELVELTGSNCAR